MLKYPHMNKHNQLIYAILSHSQDLIGVSDRDPDEKELDGLYQKVANGQINRSDWNSLISAVPGPDTQIEKLHEIATNTEEKRRILAYMSGVGFDNYEHTNAKHLKTFLERFPNPANLDAVEGDFLNAIKISKPDSLEDYKSAIKAFRNDIYGEKQSYWDEIKGIEEEARKWSADKLSLIYLKNAVIDGDPWPQGDQSYPLTIDILKAVGLGPRHEIEVGGVNIALSDSFIAEGRDAIIAYVQTTEGTVKVRSYYRSNAQGMWRYLPDYVAEDGHITLFGRGYHQEAFVLPSVLQKELSRINLEITIDDIPGTNMSFFLAGTAKRYESKDAYNEAKGKHELSGDAYNEIQETPSVKFGEVADEKHPPESLDLDGPDAPDFRHASDEFTIFSNIYGDVKVRTFPSYDKSLTYTICEIGEGEKQRAWIGNIELKASVTSTGLKAEWVSIADFGTSLYVHSDRAGEYGDEEDKNGIYISMWENYLKRMPIIKRYFYSGRDETNQRPAHE